MEFLTQSWQRSQRFESTFSVIMADIDFFKKINDEYGHPSGDAVLQAVATQLQSMVRKVDLVARFGGEEFVIVMQEASLDAAVELAQRMRQAISALRLKGIEQAVTCSFGVAQLTPERNVDQLLKQADEALYHSKLTGRNRVTGTARVNAGYPDQSAG